MAREVEIVQVLAEQGFQSVAALADRFGVTGSTIRRDLDRLEATELVQRTHGGVLPVKQTEAPLQHDLIHRREKQAIGAAMADRILDGQTVLLAGSSTVLEVARHLHGQRLTVVTNDLRIGSEIADRRSAHLVFIGGELLPDGYTMWGPSSVQQLQNLRVNVAVFGTDTVMEDGLYSTSSYEIELKRTMHSIANESFFVADSSKFRSDALFKALAFEGISAGYTDDTVDPIYAATFPVPIIRVTP